MMKMRKLHGGIFNIFAGIVERQLDVTEAYQEYQRLLATLPDEARDDMEAAVNAVVADALELAFIFGLQVAKEPGLLLFGGNENGSHHK